MAQTRRWPSLGVAHFISDDDIFSVITFAIQEIRHFNVMRFLDNVHDPSMAIEAALA